MTEFKPGQQWVSVEEMMPEPCQKVLATFKNSLGNRRRIIGYYLPRHHEVLSCGSDVDGEYSDEDDEYYYLEGWYECIENWGDYSSVMVCEGKIDYWMELPVFEDSTND